MRGRSKDFAVCGRRVRGTFSEKSPPTPPKTIAKLFCFSVGAGKFKRKKSFHFRNRNTKPFRATAEKEVSGRKGACSELSSAVTHYASRVVRAEYVASKSDFVTSIDT